MTMLVLPKTLEAHKNKAKVERTRKPTQPERAQNGVYVTVGSVTKSLTAWSAVSGRHRGTINKYLKKGWAPSMAVFGSLDNLKKAAKRTGLDLYE